MKKIIIHAIALLALFTVATPAFAKEKTIASSAPNTNKIDFKSFFKGEIEIHGVEQDKNDRIISSFTGKNKISWEENRGVIQQSIIYGDGKKDTKTWLISFDNDTDFGIVVHDMNGLASGQTGNNLVNMKYTFNVLVDGKKRDVRYTEVIYFIDASSAISITENSLGVRKISFLRKDK